MSNPTSELNKYVVSIHGDHVTFTDEIWAAISSLVDKEITNARKCEGCKTDTTYCAKCEEALQS